MTMIKQSIILVLNRAKTNNNKTSYPSC